MSFNPFAPGFEIEDPEVPSTVYSLWNEDQTLLLTYNSMATAYTTEEKAKEVLQYYQEDGFDEPAMVFRSGWNTYVGRLLANGFAEVLIDHDVTGESPDSGYIVSLE